MQYYRAADKPEGLRYKQDESPLTMADLASDRFIRQRLGELTPDVPVISEETVPESYEERKDWRTFWLVDPLDGTKEFVKKSGEFTVNIGLIHNGIPVLGVIEIPALGQRYFAAQGSGSWYETQQKQKRIEVREPDKQHIAIVASRDHAGPMVEALAERYPGAEFRSMGSSLKFCLVASGEADVYLRDVPTMEWDTAAAHAIVLESGGQINTLDGKPLTYNKPVLRNPSIITSAVTTLDWLPESVQASLSQIS